MSFKRLVLKHTFKQYTFKNAAAYSGPNRQRSLQNVSAVIGETTVACTAAVHLRARAELGRPLAEGVSKGVAAAGRNGLK
jgi:hypothetical protein